MSEAKKLDQELLRFVASLEELEQYNRDRITNAMKSSIARTLRRLRTAYTNYIERMEESGEPYNRYTIEKEITRYKELMAAGNSLLDAKTMQMIVNIYEQDLQAAYQLGEQAGVDLAKTVEKGEQDFEEGRETIMQMPTAAQTVAGQRLRAFWNKERAELRQRVTEATLGALQTGKGWRGAQADIADALRGMGQTILTRNDELSVTARTGFIMRLEDRADLIAKTELASAYVQGQLKEYNRMGFHYGRWSATGERSCPYCVSREGAIYNIEELQKAIPAHPRCRCTIAPVSDEMLLESGVKSKKSEAKKREGAAEFLDDGGWLAIREQRFEEWMKFSGKDSLNAEKYLSMPTNTEKFFKGKDAEPVRPVWVPGGQPQPDPIKTEVATQKVIDKPTTTKSRGRNLKSEQRELKRQTKDIEKTQDQINKMKADGMTQQQIRDAFPDEGKLQGLHIIMAQILRIIFRSGKIAEYRGNDETVERLFINDTDNIIDYIMSIDVITGDIGFFTEIGDVRFQDDWVLTCPVMIRREPNSEGPERAL